jgi:ABC-type branched-subunit amino acid transport system substrate-binding protein
VRRMAQWCALLGVGAVTIAAAGCGGHDSPSSSSSGNVFIGIEGTLSGAEPVPAFTDGAVDYLKMANSTNLVPHIKFTYKVADTANNGAQALTVTRDFIQADGADAIISFGSVPIDALKAAASSLKVPIIASGDGDLFVNSATNMYTAVPSYLAMWHYAMQLVPSHFHDSTASLVYQDDSFGQPASAAANQFASSSGITVSTQVPVPDTTTSDFTPFAARLKASGAKIVIAALAPELLAGVEAAANQLGYNPIWLTNWGAEETSVLTAIGAASARTYAVDFLPPIDTTKTSAMNAYKSGVSSADLNNEFAEQGWNEAAVLVKAVDSLVAAHQSVSPTSLQNAMLKVSGSIGTMTNFSYTSSKHYGVNDMALLAYKNGDFVQITPFVSLPAS